MITATIANAIEKPLIIIRITNMEDDDTAPHANSARAREERKIALESQHVGFIERIIFYRMR